MRFVAALVVLTSLAGFLAGCAQYNDARDANLAAAAQDRVAADDAKCQSSGLQPGTPTYDDCRRRLANEQASGTRGYQRMIDQMVNTKPF